MKSNAILFIFSSVIYNLIDYTNDIFLIISKKILDDAWYVLIYWHLCYFFYKSRKQNIYLKVAFWVSTARLIYNFGILLNIIEFTPYQSTFFVPFFCFTFDNN